MHATGVPSALDSSLITTELKSGRRETALAEMVGRAAEAGAVRSPAALLDLLAVRGRLVGAALGHAAALIAARTLTVADPLLVIGRSRRGIGWDANDRLPVRLVAVLLSPGDRPLASHYAALARVAALLRQQRSRGRLLDAECADDLVAVMREALS